LGCLLALKIKAAKVGLKIKEQKSEGVIYACITVQAYLLYSFITATLRLHYGYIAAAFLNCGCITCISVQQNFEVLTPRKKENL
jgi:hypothetical protein